MIVKEDAPDIQAAFLNYVDEWQALERAYRKIPSWRWFKQMHNLRHREQLTRHYIARMKHWGII